MDEVSEHEEASLIGNDQHSLENGIINDSVLYENTISSCGFGKFQIILLLVCGWALASDSVEIQV